MGVGDEECGSGGAGCEQVEVKVPVHVDICLRDLLKRSECRLLSPLTNPESRIENRDGDQRLCTLTVSTMHTRPTSCLSPAVRHRLHGYVERGSACKPEEPVAHVSNASKNI